MPKSKLGKWSVGCLGLFVLFLLIGNIVVASGQEGGETFVDNLYISIPMTLAGLSGIAAFVTGLVSIIKSRERSPLVYVATVIGLLLIIFLAGELFGPDH